MTKSDCADCGSTPVNHTLTKVKTFIDHISEEYLAVLNHFLRRLTLLDPYLEKPALFLLKILVVLGRGKINTEPKDYDIKRTKVLWEAARDYGIELRKFELFGNPTQIFWATYKGIDMVFMGLPRPRGWVSDSFDWMDNKYILSEKLLTVGIPAPRGGKAWTEKQALKLFKSLRKPLITKPILGSLSRHTSLHLNTQEEFLNGFRKAKQISPWVMVQEELEGLGIYRPTIVGGKLVGIVNKEPPHVVGTGTESIRQLVDIENRRPERQGPIFHLIPTDEAASKYLAAQNLQWDSVLKLGEVIALSEKTSRTIGGSITDYTDTAHPDNIALFEQIGKLLNDPIIGIDFIIVDMKKSWKDQERCGVIECNSLPFIDLHDYPLNGIARHPARDIWQLAYPQLGTAAVKFAH